MVAALAAADGIADVGSCPVDVYADSHLLSLFNGFAGDYGYVACIAKRLFNARSR